MTGFPFSMDGPHSPERTAEAAELIAEAVRFLGYASRSGAGGLEYPSDVYDVLGSLSPALGGLVQLYGHLGAWLAGQNEAGRISVTEGSAAEAVKLACALLLDACTGMGRAQAALGRAHEVTSTMSGKEGSGDG